MSADRLRGSWLAPRLAPARVLVFARLGSTNQTAEARIESGALRAPAVVVAARQTAGRGQRTNRWWADAGSLCATFVTPASAHPVGQVPLRAGLAVAAIVDRYCRGACVRLKWPNDVWVEGRKIAGILCRRIQNCDVIGIGLNVRTDLRRMPRALRAHATALTAHTRRAPSRARLLVELWQALQCELSREDFERAYARRNALLGQTIDVRLDDSVRAGRCTGIDAEGRLCVELGGALVRITESDALVAHGSHRISNGFPSARHYASAR